ncbi:MAG: VOC family protein [Candidatus Eisenbacteria bacterium]|uniref:VOC family protein n=1 Tax=Eiseniibacteriota bacterium TaxID=2212470 RepID=A0A956NGA4_UNCEI|nr:VOC family protein [Candidatus Eisenbacteria bacterium]MCB9465300.1 VOC family protein [Candidatus Eisenbacteria bacterium]
MSSVSTYLNFNGNTAEAFEFYKSVFGTDFAGPVMRMSDIPPTEGMPPVAEADKNMVMHVALPILGGHMLMGTDTSESCGGRVATFGNNVHISLLPDTRKETDQLFSALSEGGTVTMPLADMFWGDYFGSLTDKFGVHWMFNCSEKK